MPSARRAGTKTIGQYTLHQDHQHVNEFAGLPISSSFDSRATRLRRGTGQRSASACGIEVGILSHLKLSLTAFFFVVEEQAALSIVLAIDFRLSGSQRAREVVAAAR